jgi:hypothetical protein
VLADGKMALSWSGDHSLRLWDLERMMAVVFFGSGVSIAIPR